MKLGQVFNETAHHYKEKKKVAGEGCLGMLTCIVLSQLAGCLEIISLFFEWEVYIKYAFYVSILQASNDPE